jgi:hypothetical protein
MTATPIFIDATLDLRFDAQGKDADRYSPTMRSYHQQLWSKPLPTGGVVELEDVYPRGYLLYRSEARDIYLSSDTIIRTFTSHPRMQDVLSHIPDEERAEFSRLGYTIGAMILFPGLQIDRKQTINQERGMSSVIADRFDLTLEAIRRHYERDVDSPLSAVLDRYNHFFALFGDFKGYVDFFLLQDLVTEDYSKIRFFAPFTNFESSGLIASVDEYLPYRARTLDFLRARNARIDATNAVLKLEL